MTPINIDEIFDDSLKTNPFFQLGLGLICLRIASRVLLRVSDELKAGDIRDSDNY